MADDVHVNMLVGSAGARADASPISQPLASNWGAQRVAPEGGIFQEWTRRGYIFVARSGAAAAIPVNTTMTNAPTLWNPLGSGKILVPIKILLSAAALGTQVIDGLTLSYESGMGDTAGSGLGFASFTNIAPKCTRIDASAPSAAAKFANAAVTWTAQPTAFMDLGIGQWLNGTAANGEPYTLRFDFDGTVMVAPGSAIAVGAATAATSGTYWTSIVYAELPQITF